MRALILAFVFFLFQSVTLSAQTDLAPCGSHAPRTAWLKSFQLGTLDLPEQQMDSVTLGLHVHLLANDNGSSPFRFEVALEALAALERDFIGTGIRFTTDPIIDTINSSFYNDHSDVLQGADMMFANNEDQALNVYLVRNPAGNCGYNLPYAGIAVGLNCARLPGKTIAHEVGHALSLPHPFLGWEGGPSYDGSVQTNFGAPAPVTVTYDYTYFQDTLIRDTLIIDTALVELVARTNCLEAGDGFCDTPADYVASRWTCNSTGESVTQIDPDGVMFRSDGSLIMSYSDDACQSRFSNDQAEAMRAFAFDQRASWIRTGVDTALVRGDMVPRFTDGEALPDATKIEFESKENATQYYSIISERASFSRILVDQVTDSPTIPLDPSQFEAGEKYFIKVYPYNNHSFRAGMSSTFEFVYPQNSGINEQRIVKKLTVAPNPVGADRRVRLLNRMNESLQFSLIDALGKRLPVDNNLSFTNDLVLPSNLPAGMYTLIASTNANVLYQTRLIIN